MVERQLPKLDVAGSSPVFRSITKKSRPCDGAFSVQCDGTRTPWGREAFSPIRPADGRSQDYSRKGVQGARYGQRAPCTSPSWSAILRHLRNVGNAQNSHPVAGAHQDGGVLVKFVAETAFHDFTALQPDNNTAVVQMFIRFVKCLAYRKIFRFHASSIPRKRRLCQFPYRRSMRQPTTQPTKVDTSATGMAYRRRLSSMRDV